MAPPLPWPQGEPARRTEQQPLIHSSIARGWHPPLSSPPVAKSLGNRVPSLHLLTRLGLQGRRHRPGSVHGNGCRQPHRGPARGEQPACQRARRPLSHHLCNAGSIFLKLTGNRPAPIARGMKPRSPTPQLCFRAMRRSTASRVWSRRPSPSSLRTPFIGAIAHFLPASFRPPQLQDSIRKFADARLAPHAARIDADNNFPEIREFWKELGDMGLLGITAPGTLFMPPNYLLSTACTWGGGVAVIDDHHCLTAFINICVYKPFDLEHPNPLPDPPGTTSLWRSFDG